MADLSARIFVRRGTHLVPADWMAEEWVTSFPEEHEVAVTARRSRSPKNHRHFFAVLHLAFKHLEAYQAEDDLLDAVKIACGHTRPVQRMVGKTDDDEAAAQCLEDAYVTLEMDIRTPTEQLVAVRKAIKRLRTETEIIWLPKSINWDSFDEDEFKRFKDRAVFVLSKMCGFDVVAAFEEEIKARERARQGSNF